MANVTWMGPKGGTYSMGWAGKTYIFPAREIVSNVPEDVAERCKAVKDSQGEYQFVIDMNPKDPDADVAEFFGVQEEFTNWP